MSAADEQGLLLQRYGQLREKSIRLEESMVEAYLKAGNITKNSQTGRYESPGENPNLVPLIDQEIDRVHESFSGVADIFTPFVALPDPADFRDAMREIASVAGVINTGQSSKTDDGNLVLGGTGLAGMADVRSLVEDWSGYASQSFQDNFLSPWPTITANQSAMVLALHGAVEAEATIWKNVRANIVDLVEKAQHAVDAAGECSPEQVALNLTVAASIVSVVATPASGAGALALTFVGEALSIASSLPGEKKEIKHSVGSQEIVLGGSLKEIETQVRSAAEALRGEIITAEAAIEAAVNANIAVMTDPANQSRFVSARPLLADKTSSSITHEYNGMGKAY
ncbi:hypothetical protein [Kineosporia babensis]|uniref:Uncharacterized protein n=1 Tax=Kineosporia babensis TaxID=499548 RepID=A0A9X1ND20_9ACTN|nr:hypothetical protein [Kineosporia babensis]MCD5311870.1 hypothetical protein [Kineosporia babensis]